VGYATYNPGFHNPDNTPSIYDAIPPMGQYGIGAESGTVFKQIANPFLTSAQLATAGPGGAAPRPYLKGQFTPVDAPTEPIIYVPAPDGTDNAASPLIYIYQTTITY
jgi:hypothetical protein